MSHKTLVVAATALLATLALHELAARWLAGTTLVAALLAPAGARSILVLLGALGFLGIRFALLVLAPGVVSAVAAVAVGRWVAARRETK